MKIYTRTGDDGTTALFDGSRVQKSDELVDLYGELDECNAVIGLARSFIINVAFQQKLTQVQKDLFALGAKLANPAKKKQKEKADFNEDKVGWLESEIDQMEHALTPMRRFILPGGSAAGGSLHLARSVCRRAERKLVRLMGLKSLDAVYLKYLNRLSDYLFVAARYANFLEGKEDIPW